MRKLVAIVAIIPLATATTAQAHNIGHKGKDRIGQYIYYKANLDHAETYLAEHDQWQLVGHQHNVTVSTDDEVTYHRNLARNSWKGIQSLVPHKNSWMCIHRFEGSWQDPNSPYYGGLQMDLGFQKHYGSYFLYRKGTANYWTPMEQMIVAEIAYHSGRGFYPWPNTARYCNLI